MFSSSSSPVRKPALKPPPAPRLDDIDYLNVNLLEGSDDELDNLPRVRHCTPNDDPGSNRLVIAIDYGTNSTAVAYAFPRSEHASLDDVSVVEDWGPQMSIMSRVPSIISYSPPSNQIDLQWGASISDEAVTMIHTKTELKQPTDKLSELRSILNLLEGTSCLDFEYVQKAGGSPEYTLKKPEEIVTDYLTKVCRYVLDSFELIGDHLRKYVAVDIVVTVPVAWSQRSRNLLLQAVWDAGFNEKSFPNLQDYIVLTEPEAAAMSTLRYLKEYEKSEFLELGDCFILCYAGHRVVEALAYRVTQIEPTMEFEAVTEATGEDCGFDSINTQFKRWFRAKTGDRNYSKLDPRSYSQQICPHPMEEKGMRQLMQRFNARKGVFSNRPHEVHIDLPPPLNTLNIPGRVTQGDLRISWEEMSKMFEPCIDNIIEIIKMHLSQVKQKKLPIRDVLLVGGFGESQYLQEELHKSLRLRNIKLRRRGKQTSWTSVVQGAVLYGIEKSLRKDIVALRPKEFITSVGDKPSPISHKSRQANFLENSTKNAASSSATATTGHEDTTLQDTDGAKSTLPTTVLGNTNEIKSEVEDTQSTFTDDQSLGLPEVQRTTLIRDIAGKVWDSTAALVKLQEEHVDRISAALPNLLKELSLELSYNTDRVIEKRAVAFIRRYRCNITDSFHASKDTLEEESEWSRRNSDGLTVAEKMKLWNTSDEFHEIDQTCGSEWVLADAPNKKTLEEVSDTNARHHQAPDGRIKESIRHLDLPTELLDDGESLKSNDISNGDKLDNYTTIPDLPEAWSFIFGSQAFTRLLENLQVIATLTPRKGEVIEVIRNQIIETIASSASFRDRTASNSYFSSFFQVSWDPLAFIEKEYDNVDLLHIRDVITLNGHAIDAQAAACGQYVEQTWGNSGMEILETVQKAISCPGISQIWTLNDGTTIDVNVSRGLLLVNATGSMIKLAEIGEELAWIGASCQSSQYTNRFAECTASIVPVRSPVPSFLINFSQEDIEDDSTEGSCWRKLFNNPVTAKGFPILARSNDEKGLEIPLNMMAWLGGAEQATIFDGQLLIKGFSSMFVPTKMVQNSILWHFCFNKDNSRISYALAKQIRGGLAPVKYEHLPTSRMFLGWASSVDLYTGARDVQYTDLQFTGSNFSTSGCALSGVSITAGKFITGGASFVAGNKDRALSLTNSEPYGLKIESASTWNVVLYDTADRRAWLVDGANALLHLTRARLSQARFARNPQLNLERFPHADPAHGRDAALRALEAIAETHQVLIADTTSFGQSSSATNDWGLKDIVLGYWHILEQIQEHQEILSGPGMPLRMTDREKLEGFGFVDIISGRTSIRPRVAYLESSGRGWVDFLRQIRAITLMARGFGELIKPTNRSNPVCTAWQNVPTGRDYLIARVAQLYDICEFGGDLNSQPIELVQGLYWHKGGHLFEPCNVWNCQGRCDRVQVLLPKTTLGFKRYPDGLFSGNMEGAVVFGHSRRLPKFWPRNPKSGPKDDQVECDAEDSRISLPQLEFHDSGLGTDLTKSRTESSLPSQSSMTNNTSPPVMSGGLRDSQFHGESSAGPSDLSDRIVLPYPSAPSRLASRMSKGKKPIRPLTYMMENLGLGSKKGKGKERD